MKTISQRELRNDNAEIVRAVGAGESFIVTRRGVPVAQIGPVSTTDPRVTRPVRHRPRFSDQQRVTLDISTAELLDDLRGDR